MKENNAKKDTSLDILLVLAIVLTIINFVC